MALKYSEKSLLAFGWMSIAVAYLVLVAPRLGRPFVGWEALVWEIPRQIAYGGYAFARFFYLLPLYDSLIALSFKIAGLSELSARLPGVVVYLAMPAMIYMLAGELVSGSDKRPVGLIACAIFCSSPLVIQGSLVIDRSDTTILLFAMTLFYLALLRTEGSPLSSRVILLGPLYAFCLWAKITTPLACLAAVPVSYILCRRAGKGIIMSLGVFALGAALLLATWWAFCNFVIGPGRFFEPFSYYLSAAFGAAAAVHAGAFARVAQDLFRAYLWLSPFLILSVIYAAVYTAKKYAASAALAVKDTQLILFTGVVAIGYLCVGLTFSGFPKYIAPVMGASACIAAKFIWGRIKGSFGVRDISLTVCLIFFGTIYYMIFVKDWIYATYFLREARLYGLSISALTAVLLQQIKYLAFPAVAYIASKAISMPPMKRFTMIILASLISSNLALDIMHSGADYSVSFAYGSRGARELKDFIRINKPANVFSSIEGYVANAGLAPFYAIDAYVWNDPLKFSSLLHKYDPKCIIYGLGSNTVFQLKNTMNDPALRALLDASYTRTAIGSYNVLLKRQAAP